MRILRALFGPSQDEVWQELCREIGADFVRGGFWRGNQVQARVKEWTVTLDTFTQGGESSTTYTRIRAPYVNKDGFRFKIYRKSIFSGLGKKLGMQDLEVGYPEFDDAFIIQGNNADQVRRLFSNANLRQLLQAQPRVCFEVKHRRGGKWLGTGLPEGVEELHFQVAEVIQDVQRLKALYTLFALTLHLLCHLGSAYEEDPKIKL